MRREGYELSITPPQVVTRKDESGNLLEPFEKVEIEADLEHTLAIIDKMNNRKGILME